MSLYFIILSAILSIFRVNYCTSSIGNLETTGQSVAGDGQEEYTNSTYQFEIDTGFEDSGEHRSKRWVQQDDFPCCSMTQRQLLDGHFHNFNVLSRHIFFNYAASVGYAFLLAFESNVLKKPHRYFDIDDFLDKSGIHFPPTLPFICYDTAYGLREEPILNYGRENVLRDLNSAEGIPRPQISSGERYTPESATRHLNNDSDYMLQRRRMYEGLGNLVQNLQKGQTEILKSKCSETNYTKITGLIIDLLGDDTIQAMSPDYSMEQFSEVAKLFTGDMVAYEIIRQACIAVCTPNLSESIPEIVTADWTPVADELRIAADAIRNNWHENQLRAYILQSVNDDMLESDIADAFMKKYYEYGFRISSHEGWTIDNIIRELCDSRPNQTCVEKGGEIFLIKWESLRPAELSASYEAPQRYLKFPTVAPPPPMHRFGVLYTKVQMALKKVQNAVNYLRQNYKTTQLQKRYLHNFRMFLYEYHNPGYGLYSEMAAHFAKTTDVLNVFRKEYQPLINTLSEVAVSVGYTYRGTSIDKVWHLIDRSFNEMDFYLADIEAYSMHARLYFKEWFASLPTFDEPYFNDTVEKDFFFGDRRLEEMKKIKQAFKKYQRRARFYAEEGNRRGIPIVLKEFIDKCGAMKSEIEKLYGGMNPYLSWQVKKLGSRGPFYVQALFLVPAYDIIYLTLHSMFCMCQRYRWLAEMQLASRDRKLTTSQIQQFMRDTRQDRADISDMLDELVEGITTYAYRGKFYWIDSLQHYIQTENNGVVRDEAAESIASSLKYLFQWNNFTVQLIKSHFREHIMPERNEKLNYYKFFSNPDYSVVHVDLRQRTIIVNWIPDKAGSVMQDFGFRDGQWVVCRLATDKITTNLVNYQTIKSIFIWRADIGDAWHEPGYNQYNHVHGPDYAVEGTWDPVERPCCAYGGAGSGIKRSFRTCWYRHDANRFCGVLSWLSNCHYDVNIGIYSMANFGADYDE